MSKEKNALNPDEQELDLSENAGESMTLDLENIDESGPAYEAIPPAVYNCVVDNTEFGPSKNNNPMITWVFKVVDSEYEGRLLFHHTTLNNPRGLQRLKQILTRIVPDVDLKSFNPEKFASEGQALGYPCRVKVRIRPYQGQKRNDVQDVLPPAEGGSFLDE